MMINRQDTPAPSMRRKHRPLAPDTSRERTPRDKIAPRQRPAPRETYMDNHARGAAAEGHERISHDLSLIDNGRHSIVDNMLMSLNPDQPKAFSPPRDGLQFSTGSNPNPTPTHQNLHSSSGSPGFAFPPNESSNQLSGHLPRGQRSHSASTFQSVLRRIDSVHGENESLDHTRANSYRTQRVVGVELGSRSGRKSGKSSGSSSVDLGQMAAPSRFQQSLGRRSASFDQGDRIHIIHSVSSSTTQPQSLSGRSQPNNYDDLEAAPTPTVPGGPRKDRSLAFPQMNGQAAPQGPTPQRRNSNKSSKSYAGRKKKGDAVLWDTAVPPNGNAHVATRRGSKQSPPMPGFIRPRNGSPARQYSEPLMAQRVNSTSHSKDVIKERPGFFRRVFGSSKGQLPTTGDLHSSQLQPSNASCGANSRERTTALHGAPRWAITDDFSHPLPDANQLPLAKKPSSFFRRRKKSVSENMPPSMFPLHVQTTAPPVTDSTQESPVSSLRQVMNPYLDDPMRSNAQQFAGTTTTLQAKGSIEPIHKSYDAGNDASLNNPLRQAREAMTSRRETLTERVHLQPNNSTSSKPADNSFLHDDSSNETRIPGAIYEAQFGRHDNTKLDQTPVSLSPSLTSNKENTRSRSKYKESPESSYIRSIDSPRSRNMPSTRNDKLPASPRAAHATPVKSGARDWLTPSLKPGKSQVSPPSSPKGSDRVWLQPNHTDSTVRKLETPVSAEGEVSPVSDYHSASSVINPGKVNDDIHFPEPTAEDAAHKLGDDKDIDRDLPTEADRAQAKQLYEGDESQVSNVTAAAWLGEPRPDRMRIRRAYVELFDWRDLNILAALRGLCGKLYLKGEAQQVDRVLDAFSNRWCACNPNHGFKATDVVHTICYSLLMLNTDLHQAGIETKMTRQQFLKNILPTIRRVVTDAAPNAFTNARASTLPSPRPWADSSNCRAKSPTFPETSEGRRSFEGQRPIYRLSQRPTDHTAYLSAPTLTPLDYNNSLGDSGPLVKTPFHGKLSTWENQIEIILKDFYSSIRQQKLPLHGPEVLDVALQPPTPTTGLSAMTNNMLRRTPSVLSKAGSENLSYSRGRQPSENRLGTGIWHSKNRSRPRVYPASTMASSRRSSIDEQSSMTSPSVTSAWSKFSSFGKTQTTLSIDTLASHLPRDGYQQSIGFANALSQAIIREEGVGAGSEEESLRAAPMLEDESLELAGAPWAKEGILKHKHHLESVNKRAKERDWVERFAVIERGYMKLFSFSMNAKSLRRKAKNQRAPGGVVGGGNWADSAETLGTFMLRQTIASALPPPGYSKARPHVWALSLPSGAVHFFQVGTPEIVKEFVTTANYWSARLSKEPMVGGISNIEYGWGDTVINAAILHTEYNLSSSAAGSSGPRPSLQSSIRSGRSSIDQVNFKPRLAGDRIFITDWTPPQQSMVASVLMEVDQLKVLNTYVKNITQELEKHNELRAAMLLAFSSRHPNSTKAMANWERKSSYLLHEIVKFRTYIDCLQAAQSHKETVYAEGGKSASIVGNRATNEEPGTAHAS